MILSVFFSSSWSNINLIDLNIFFILHIFSEWINAISKTVSFHLVFIRYLLLEFIRNSLEYHIVV